MKHWSTACIDWEKRIIKGESLIAFEPLFPSEADEALEVFKSLYVTDLPKFFDDEIGDYRFPTFGEVSEPWVFDFVRAIFGAYDHGSAKRLIREFFLLISKKNGKSTIAAAIMLTALIRNWRHSAELLILAPTKEIAGNSYKPAADMVRADLQLTALIHIQDNYRTLTHRVTGAVLKVVAADTETVGGKKAAFILVDELWIFGKRPGASAMFREAMGGMSSKAEGFVIYLSTQSDEQPTGVFKEKLQYFRDVRDGKITDPKSLPVLYEFPESMIVSQAYLDPANFKITNPNIDKSVMSDWLLDELVKARRGDKADLNIFLAKHLNVEIGLKLRTDRWAGADFWLESSAYQKARAEAVEMGPEAVAKLQKPARISSIEELLRRCEVVVVGIDGGGLDDLLGLAVLGRERKTGNWLLWCRAWAHRIVFERRKQIEEDLKRFEAEGTLTIVDLPGQDVAAVADIVMQIEEAGLLAEEYPIGVDAAGIGDIVDELTSEERGIEKSRIVGISQGWKLNGAIKTTERKVASGQLIHEGTELMSWCVGNAKTVPVGSAITINKAVSGSAKIDPLMAVFDAVSLMSLNPEPMGSAYEDEDAIV